LILSGSVATPQWLEPAGLKTRFIVNPRSGRNRVRSSRALAFASRHGHAVALTAHPGHAADLARRALDDGCELVVAVGGDGTLNEVAGALLDGPVTLGLVPCGSGNGLARHLGIYGSHRHVFRTLTEGRSCLIDTGLADGRPFFTTAGLGFEAEISARFNESGHRGFLRYLALSIRAFREWQPEDCFILHDSSRERVHAFTLTAANASQYGNHARIAPHARVDDGLLDLCVVPPITPWNALPLLGRLFTGTLAGAPGITFRKFARFTVERAKPGLIHTDGEVHQAGARVEFAIRPRSLRVLVPRGAATGTTTPR
jgi:diacylglycerol kinase (ATP)